MDPDPDPDPDTINPDPHHCFFGSGSAYSIRINSILNFQDPALFHDMDSVYGAGKFSNIFKIGRYLTSGIQQPS